ncbi:tRNA (adenosine(37)-N6)-threonylcarbamoyltransferase complex dimerization subunit type 1 TsaB [Candidatus Falkowbacteria bacterium]|nr:tRNA (adenosine(37)-N6)-threonylcarbamoyltransferase complex dimerization subunit type 1 TsaB [Candidatus Falkowbacteria bacterium]
MFLFVDTSATGKIHLSLFTSTQKVDDFVFEGGNTISEKLPEVIEEFLSRHTIVVSSLEGIIVVTGPGSFTSLRIACAVANTLSQTLGIALFGAPLSELDTDEKIILATSKVAKGITLVPAYDREANITIRSQESEVGSQ